MVVQPVLVLAAVRADAGVMGHASGAALHTIPTDTIHTAITATVRTAITATVRTATIWQLSAFSHILPARKMRVVLAHPTFSAMSTK